MEEKEIQTRDYLDGSFISFNLRWVGGKWEMQRYRSNAPNGVYVTTSLGSQANNKESIGFTSVGFSMIERFITAQASNIDYRQGATPVVLPIDVAGGMAFAIRTPCKGIDYRTDGTVRWVNLDETKMIIHVSIIL